MEGRYMIAKACGIIKHKGRFSIKIHYYGEWNHHVKEEIEDHIRDDAPYET